MRITDIKAHEILDSKGDPTLEVSVILEDGTTALSQVPSGASTGSAEAVELRDNDATRYAGKGVLNAINNIHTEIKQALVGQEALNQASIDQILIQLDGTPNKARLGGNSLTGVSMAVCRAAAQSQHIELYQYFGMLTNTKNFELPLPMILIMEGGKHGDWATDIQEFMVIPSPDRFPTFRQKLEAAASIFHILGKSLSEKGYDAGVGFEGAYAPRQLQSNQEAFELIMYAINRAGYQAGTDITLAIDVAASEFFELDHYVLRSEKDRQVAAEQWLAQLETWTKQFPLVSVEDPFHESQWQAWQLFTQNVGQNIQVVGDDLVATNVNLIQKAIDAKAMNSTLIKINQIGTITEALNAMTLSNQAGFQCILSQRGGETNDDLIADMSVGAHFSQCKFGGPDRGERLAKYNRLLRIENQLLGI